MGLIPPSPALKAWTLLKKNLPTSLIILYASDITVESQPLMALVSPTAVEATQGVTTGESQNANLKIYAEAMREIAKKKRITFVDAFNPSLDWYKDGNRHTIDGALLNDLGNRKLAKLLCDQIFGRGNPNEKRRSAVHEAVMDKNFYWLNDFKIPNGVHVYGRRYNPFGPKNYPFEIQKLVNSLKLGTVQFGPPASVKEPPFL